MKKSLRSVALVGSIALLLGACSPSTLSDGNPDAVDTSSVDLEQSNSVGPRSSIAEMVERVLPSVVNVRVTSFGLDQFGAQESRGQGSGVVIDSDGIILTNAHVIRGAVKVEVVLQGGRNLEGEVLGAAPERDLAVIKVDAHDLTPIELGHSDPPDLRLGEAVVAIGFPLGLGGPTVTKGILSGEDRNIQVDGGTESPNRLEGMLQTDAAINPGNSGGALVNTAGQLVGINSAAALASSAENIGFAIAIDDALPVVEEILAEPQEERAWMGVFIDEVTPLVAGQLGLPRDTRGAAVVELVPGGPALEAGIEEGEVIVGVDGAEVRSADDLTSALTELTPGDEVDVDLVGPDGDRTVSVTLDQRPASFPS